MGWATYLKCPFQGGPLASFDLVSSFRCRGLERVSLTWQMVVSKEASCFRLALNGSCHWDVSFNRNLLTLVGMAFCRSLCRGCGLEGTALKGMVLKGRFVRDTLLKHLVLRTATWGIDLKGILGELRVLFQRDHAFFKEISG